MKYIVILLLAISCSEEIGPCYSIEQRCKELQAKINQATGAEKEQLKQFYLSEKQLLEHCYSQN